jgi:hypothetical protein
MLEEQRLSQLAADNWRTALAARGRTSQATTGEFHADHRRAFFTDGTTATGGVILDLLMRDT